MILSNKNNLTRLTAALEYATKGLSVLPVHAVINGLCTCGNANCSHPGKHPVTRNGFKDATIDSKIIDQWWSQNDYNIGLVPGSAGLVVVDVDDNEALSKLIQEHGNMGFDTAPSVTTGKGRHYYFRADGIIGKTNSSGGLPKGIDIRGEGGYVLAPPSIHPTGSAYIWNNIDNLDKLFATAQPIDPVFKAIFASESKQKVYSKEKVFVEKIPIGKRNATITSNAGSYIKKGLDKSKVLLLCNEDNNKLCEEPLPKEEVERIVNSIYKIHSSKNTNPSPKKESCLGSDVGLAKLVIEDIKKKHGDLVYTEGGLYYYQDTHWHILSPDEIECNFIHEYDGIYFGNKQNDVIKLSDQKTKGIYNRLVNILRNDNKEEGGKAYFTKAPVGINCLSGFITFSEDGKPTLHPHLAEQRQRHVLQNFWHQEINWRVDGSYLSKFLDGIFPDDWEKQGLLQEVAGATICGLSTSLRGQKAVVLLGSKAANGKSQFLSLLRNLVPADSVCSVPLTKMCDEKYVVELRGKLLNTSDELSLGGGVSSDIFKKVVTGDPVTGRGLYKDPITFSSKAINVFATNVLPTFKGGMDNGIERRLMVIPFERTIPIAERIADIGELIKKHEGDLLFAWAIEGASRLIKAGDYTKAECSKDALKDWITGSDSVRAWIDECVEIIPIDKSKKVPFTESGHAYKRYKDWAESNHYRHDQIFSKNVFSQKMKAIEGIECTRTNKSRGFLGMCFPPQEKHYFNPENVVYLDQQH